jgi:hypothetical protein
MTKVLTSVVTVVAVIVIGIVVDLPGQPSSPSLSISGSGSAAFFVAAKDAVNHNIKAHSGGKRSSNENDDDDDDHDKCGLYLAVSSTSTAETPKLGVFAGRCTQINSFCLFNDTVYYIYFLAGSCLAMYDPFASD